MSDMETFDRRCNSCRGTGRVPISNTAKIVLQNLQSAKCFMVTNEVYDDMGSTWKRRYGRTAINAVLDQLLSVGAVERESAQRGYRWRAISADQAG